MQPATLDQALPEVSLAPTTYSVRAVKVGGRVYVDRDDVAEMLEGDAVHARLSGDDAGADRLVVVADRVAGFVGPPHDHRSSSG